MKYVTRKGFAAAIEFAERERLSQRPRRDLLARMRPRIRHPATLDSIETRCVGNTCEVLACLHVCARVQCTIMDWEDVEPTVVHVDLDFFDRLSGTPSCAEQAIVRTVRYVLQSMQGEPAEAVAAAVRFHIRALGTVAEQGPSDRMLRAA
jgi:hypothetical protein